MHRNRGHSRAVTGGCTSGLLSAFPHHNSLSLLLSICFLLTSSPSFSSSHKVIKGERKTVSPYLLLKISASAFLPSSSSSWFPFSIKSEVIHHSFEPQNQETPLSVPHHTKRTSYPKRLPQEDLQIPAQWLSHSPFFLFHLKVLFSCHQSHHSKQQSRSSQSLVWRNSGIPSKVQNVAQDP